MCWQPCESDLHLLPKHHSVLFAKPPCVLSADPDKLLQLQLEQLTAHEKALIAELSVTMPADSDILVN